MEPVIVKIADLNESSWLERLQLVIDPEEIESILRENGAANDGYGCLWAESRDGEYVNVFASYAYPPRLDALVEHLIGYSK